MTMFKRKNKLHVHKGDEVMVIAGEQRGSKGIVKNVFTKNSTIIVEGVNQVKKAIKVTQSNKEHYMMVEKPIFSSKVKVVKTKTKKDVHSKGKKC